MDQPTSTFHLLEKARAGERDALSLLFEKHRRRLAVLIYFKMGEKARRGSEVDDILQETLLRAFRDFETFTYRSPGSFLRWISSIADHVIIDRLRYSSREQRAGEEIPFRSESNPYGPEPADSQTPSRLFAQREALERLVEKLELLPEEYRQAILMSKFEGLSTGEIAERLGRSREAAALLVYRALKRLRALAAKTGA